MNTTTLLKKSIDYEQSKTDVNNLLNHKRQDLSVGIEAFDVLRHDLKHRIDSNQFYVDDAEDMEEGLEAKLRKDIASDKAKLETLLAWRMLYLTAWRQVTR